MANNLESTPASTELNLIKGDLNPGNPAATVDRFNADLNELRSNTSLMNDVLAYSQTSDSAKANLPALSLDADDTMHVKLSTDKGTYDFVQSHKNGDDNLVVRDTQGRVTSEQPVNGFNKLPEMKLDWDSQGLKTFTDNDGTKYERQKDGNFTDNKKGDGEFKISVDNQTGTITGEQLKDANGNDTITTRKADGEISYKTTSNDGKSVTTSGVDDGTEALSFNNIINSQTFSDGTTRTFQSGTSAQNLVSFKDTDGKTWTLEDGVGTTWDSSAGDKWKGYIQPEMDSRAILVAPADANGDPDKSRQVFVDTQGTDSKPLPLS